MLNSKLPLRLILLMTLGLQIFAIGRLNYLSASCRGLQLIIVLLCFSTIGLAIALTLLVVHQTNQRSSQKVSEQTDALKEIDEYKQIE